MKNIQCDESQENVVIEMIFALADVQYLCDKMHDIKIENKLQLGFCLEKALNTAINILMDREKSCDKLSNYISVDFRNRRRNAS